MRIGQLDRDARKLLLAAASVANPTVELLAAGHRRPVELLGDAEAKGIIGIDGNHGAIRPPAAGPERLYRRESRRAPCHAPVTGADRDAARTEGQAYGACGLQRGPGNTATLWTPRPKKRRPGARLPLRPSWCELAIGLGGDQPERRIHAAEHHFNAGDPERARALLEETVDRLPSGPLRGSALNLLAGVHLYDDNWTEAVAVLERALDDAEDSPALLVQTLIVLAFGQRMISKFDESLAMRAKAVTNAEQLGDPALISRALAMSVQLNFMYGNGVDETQSATRGGVGGSRHRRAHPVQRQHGRGFGTGLDRAAGRGRTPECRRCTADAPSAAPRTISPPWRAAMRWSRSGEEILPRPRDGRTKPRNVPSKAAVPWRSPFRCGPWWLLTLGEKMIRAPTPGPSWISRTEGRRRVSPSGR